LSLAATIAGAVSAVVSALQLSFLFGGADDEDGPFGLLAAFAVMLLAPLGLNGHGWARTSDLSRVKRALSH
jgi:hypothetical protein